MSSTDSELIDLSDEEEEWNENEDTLLNDVCEPGDSEPEEDEVPCVGISRRTKVLAKWVNSLPFTTTVQI